MESSMEMVNVTWEDHQVTGTFFAESFIKQAYMAYKSRLNIIAEVYWWKLSYYCLYSTVYSTVYSVVYSIVYSTVHSIAYSKAYSIVYSIIA